MPPEKIDFANSGTIGAVMPLAVIARVEKLAAVEGIGKSGYLRRLVLQHLAALDEASSSTVSA